MLKYRKENIGAIRYTEEHRKAYKKIQKDLLGHNTWRSLVHDLDKVILYNFLPFKEVKKFHRNTARHHDNIIKKSKEFVINLTNEELAYATDWCGVKSGKDFDKFEKMHLTKEKANFIKCPMIKEAPVSIECKVKEIRELGSHHMFVAEVLAINADEKYIDEKGAFDISKCDLKAYSNGNYYS